MTGTDAVITYPGARRPDRRRTVSSDGVGLAVYEWGEPDAPAIVMAHGGFDFAGTFDVFAPMLAEAGYRCVAWDARGCGDSDWSLLYSWQADLRDALVVVDSVSDEPVVLLGHSKGAGILLELTDACPHRVSRLVNLDGLPSNNRWPDVSDRERTRMVQTEIASWLDHRRRTADGQRKPGTLDELAQRRARMNPRLELDWLRYLVSVGARNDPDGWRWKIDPTLRPGGFGPWRPEWSMQRVPGIGVPFLGVLGLEPEFMGWGTQPDDVTPYLPPGAVFAPLEGVGHFVHIEQPRVVADLVLDFLCVSAPAMLRHGRVELALHRLRDGEGRSLLLLHGLGEQSPARVPAPVAAWPGPIHALDFTGHGHSTVPAGGGYTAEVLLADADAALAELGPVTVLGRGLGAYVALLVSGARADLVRGAVLTDGPGLVGGGIRPPSPYVSTAEGGTGQAPDPYALAELFRDVRPPDYATEFVRMAVHSSGLDKPIAVAAVVRPEWLTAVVLEFGVVELSVPKALALYAGA